MLSEKWSYNTSPGNYCALPNREINHRQNQMLNASCPAVISRKPSPPKKSSRPSKAFELRCPVLGFPRPSIKKGHRLSIATLIRQRQMVLNQMLSKTLAYLTTAQVATKTLALFGIQYGENGRCTGKPLLQTLQIWFLRNPQIWNGYWLLPRKICLLLQQTLLRNGFWRMLQEVDSWTSRKIFLKWFNKALFL